MTDREKIEKAMEMVDRLDATNTVGAGACDMLMEALEAGHRATLDGWERASKCRQG